MRFAGQKNNIWKPFNGLQSAAKRSHKLFIFQSSVLPAFWLPTAKVRKVWSLWHQKLTCRILSWTHSNLSSAESEELTSRSSFTTYVGFLRIVLSQNRKRANLWADLHHLARPSSEEKLPSVPALANNNAKLAEREEFTNELGIHKEFGNMVRFCHYSTVQITCAMRQGIRTSTDLQFLIFVKEVCRWMVQIQKCANVWALLFAVLSALSLLLISLTEFSNF